jgi:hypothetical protein
LGWFKGGEFWRTKGGIEDETWNLLLFWENNKRVGGTCGRKPQTLF